MEIEKDSWNVAEEEEDNDAEEDESLTVVFQQLLSVSC